MRKIGKQVLFLATKEGNPRNGEGAFIRLKNGGIMYAYSEYIGTSGHDHANAQISAYFSYDEGETWGDKRVLHTKKPGELNFMSMSLLRMENGDIGLFFLKKTMDNDIINCKLHLIRSSDEALTWSDEVCCVDRDGYFVTNNDRVIKLADGRLLFPGNLHEAKPGTVNAVEDVCKECFFFVSEDDGFTWKTAGEPERCSFLETSTRTGLQENGVFQLDNGRIITWSRTDVGCQYIAYSDDGAKTWSTPMPSRIFTSPASPLQIKTIGKYTLAVFNPMPEYFGRKCERTWGRSPYVCIVSTDGGRSYPKAFYLEDDLENGYCYPALIEVEGGFLVAYYHSNNSGGCLDSAKMVKVMFDELEEA